MAIRNVKSTWRARSCGSARQNHSGQFAITARKLAEFLESVEVEEAILIQRLSDLEARSLHVQPSLCKGCGLSLLISRSRRH